VVAAGYGVTEQVSDHAVEREVLGADAVVTCPRDHLAFRPYFTDGACPLCGWRAPAPVAEPWTHRVDWVWIAFGGLLAVSVLMAIIVFVAL
jgi:hypothetical protein